MADEYLGWSREVLDIFKDYIMNFICVIFQVQDDGAFPLGLDETPDAIDLCIAPLF